MRGRTQHRRSSEDDAFAAFYDIAVVDVFRYLMKGTGGDRRLAEDLTQDTFMAAVHARQRGSDDGLSMPWLMTVARNKLIDYYRRRAREEHKLTLAWSRESGHDETGFAIDEHDALGVLEELLPSHRLVLLLRYVDDLPISEIAELVGRSVRATESILVRARHAVERALCARAAASVLPSGTGEEALDA